LKIALITKSHADVGRGIAKGVSVFRKNKKAEIITKNGNKNDNVEDG
jgi:hypothetical protein